MFSKVKNILLYALFLGLGSILGIFFFDRVMVPFIIGSGKAFPIPNIVALSYEDARQITDRERFRLKVVREEFSSTVPENRILAQIPKAGSLAKKGRMIRVVVSKGGVRSIVPEIRGLVLRQAEISIEQMSLRIGEKTEVFDDSISEGKIISTEPAAGDTVPAGTEIRLYISKGSAEQMIEVPNLVGMKAQDAKITLERLGLVYDFQIRRIPSLSNGEVYKQSPPAGTQLMRGNVVLCIVNSFE